MSTQQIKLILNGLAEYYGVTLTPGQLAMYSEDLADIPVEALVRAISLVRQSETFFPKPAVIRSKVFGSDQDAALEASNKIVEAMGRFGWTNSEQAREFMGEVAWDVVKREGGWTALCERTKNDDLPILKSQWRNLARVVVIRKTQEHLAITDSTAPKIEHKP